MKGQSFLKVCSIILIIAGVLTLAAGGLGFMNILEAKDSKTAEKENSLASIQMLEDGANQLAANRETYEAGVVAFEEGKVTLANGKVTLAQGQQTYDEGQQTLASAKEQYNAGQVTYAEGRKAYEEGLATYNTKYQEYLAGVATYQAGLKAYEEGQATLAANTEAYETAKTLAENPTVKAGIAALEAGELVTPSVQALVDKVKSGIATYEAGQAQLAAAEKQLADGQATLADAEAQLADAREALAAAQAQLSNGKMTLEDAEKQIAAGENKLNSATGELSAGKAKLAQGQIDLADGEAQLKVFTDGIATLEAGIDTLCENERAAEIMEEMVAEAGEESMYPEQLGLIAVAAGRQAVDEATEATTKDLMSRLYCYVIAMVGALLAIVVGIIGASAAGTPSVAKIKNGIVLGGLTALVAVVANVYHLIILNQHTINLVDGFNFVPLTGLDGTEYALAGQVSTVMQAGAIAILGICAILFVVAIIKFKNALVALLTGE